MSYQVLALKYRPQSFDSIIGQGHITRTLKNAIKAGRIAHGFLFAGMRGVGKTTMARILAKALNCEHGPTVAPCNECDVCTEITQGYSMDVIEIDGASNTGVDDIRELRENVLYAPARARKKIYIIDEVHMLSKSAFNALLKTLEEPPPHVIFIFATTESHKVPITIKSRCQCFDFQRIPLQEITGQLLALSRKEGIEIDEGSARLIARASEGSMRDAQSLLDQVVSFCGDAVVLADTKLVLGQIDQEILDECTDALIAQNPEGVLSVVDSLTGRGQDLLEFCRALQSHLRDLLLIKILKAPEKVISLSEEEIKSLSPLTARIEEDRLFSIIEQLNRTEEEVRRSSNPRFVLEVALIKMVRTETLKAFKEVLLRMEALEKQLHSGGLKHVGKDGVMPSRQEKSPLTDKAAAEGLGQQPLAGKIDWDSLVVQANQTNPVLGSVLEHGFLDRQDSGRLVIGFRKKIHYEMAQAKASTAKEMLRKMLQKDLVIEFRLNEQKQAASMSPKEKQDEQRTKHRDKVRRESVENRVVKEALKVFNGKITEVREFGARS
jgi:DNA polymerase-3 subunit gamma/tau